MKGQSVGRKQAGVRLDSETHAAESLTLPCRSLKCRQRFARRFGKSRRILGRAIIWQDGNIL